VDRLIDWVGEFNSYIVPFGPFGAPTVTRKLQPQLAQYLYDLSGSDGADQTLADPTPGANPARNGEPFGELGLVIQRDKDAWHNQTGAPGDPQAGNKGGNKRDDPRPQEATTASEVAKLPTSNSGKQMGKK